MVETIVIVHVMSAVNLTPEQVREAMSDGLKAQGVFNAHVLVEEVKPEASHVTQN